MPSRPDAFILGVAVPGGRARRRAGLPVGPVLGGSPLLHLTPGPGGAGPGGAGPGGEPGCAEPCWGRLGHAVPGRV